VKAPAIIPPTISTGAMIAGSAGIMSRKISTGVGQRPARGCLWKMAMTNTVSIRKAVHISAGTMPAISSCTIETLVTEP
jgi:hypothetical protein